MNTATDKSGKPMVSCHVCHREIPRADALTVEGQEYLYYFCGQGCYARWQQEQHEEPMSPTRRQS